MIRTEITSWLMCVTQNSFPQSTSLGLAPNEDQIIQIHSLK